MVFKKHKIIILMITTSLLFSSCSLSIPGAARKEYKMGNIDYNVIDINSEKFKKLNIGDFKKWYELNYKNGGVYSFSENGIRYLLIGTGERLTSGYIMKDIVLTGKKEGIEVNARLYGPKEGEANNQVVTYPHTLLSIKDDGRKLLCSGVELRDNSVNVEIKKDSGKFDEITKNGTVKIKTSGASDANSAKEFKLDDKIKESINGMNLKKGVEIIFTYYLDKDEKPVVLEINKM